MKNFLVNFVQLLSLIVPATYILVSQTETVLQKIILIQTA